MASHNTEDLDKQHDKLHDTFNSNELPAHKIVEKKRRERTRQCIQILKDIVPISKHRSKIQKLQILENAIKYIKYNQELSNNGAPSVDMDTISETSSKKGKRMDISNLLC
ncbi:hypothetical protein BC833DRAFT_275999 [Globomyces pollinis-pini]|nr:hypothetical protein BC833DRAFT_275999 [Globomyces pollinis-pini]